VGDMVLRNLDESLKQRLRERAARHGRSMSAELREIVSVALSQPEPSRNAEFRELAARLRELSAGRRQTPSEDLLRESRDER
jgi:plasmid stability protein